MEPKLFVGNLSRSTTEEDLNSLFAQAGTVAAVELIMVQETSNPKCFAFIEMSNRGDAEKAIRLLDGSDLNKRVIKVKIAHPREKRPSGGGWYTDPPPPSSRKGASRNKSS